MATMSGSDTADDDIGLVFTTKIAYHPDHKANRQTDYITLGILSSLNNRLHIRRL
jgi:hypothetical protein